MLNLPNRKSNRLSGYDYSQNGVYFVTICTHDKKHILSRICRDSPCGCPHTRLSSLGKLAEEAVSYIEDNFNITVEKYVIMPNHIHLLILMYDDSTEYIEGIRRTATRAVPTLSDVIGAYKSKVFVDWLNFCKSNGKTTDMIWQRSYHDHIIRCQRDYDEIRQYIDENPLRWELDCYY